MFKNFGAKLTCCITAFALIVSVIAFLSLDKSLAWFAHNNKAEAGGISISVQGNGMDSSLISLGVSEITDDIYEYEYVFEGEKLKETFRLPEDDPKNV